MAITKINTKWSLKIEYKVEYDVTGDFPTLAATTVTFNKVNERATYQQLFDFANLMMGLTIYRGAPYKVRLVDSSDLVVG